MAESAQDASREDDSNAASHISYSQDEALEAERCDSEPVMKSDHDPAGNIADADAWRDNVTVVFGVFVFCFILYAMTAYPDQAPGDSGELVAAAYQLGLGHPPGYPLFCLIGKLWSIVLPFGTVAWRMNIGNAVAGAAAASTVALFGARFSRSNIAGALGGIGFGLCPVVWLFATQAEVFTLNNLFSAILLYLSLKFFENPSFPVAAAGAFSSGLGLGNQHTLVIFAVPLCAAVLIVGIVAGVIRFKQFFALAGLFLLGFSVYIYMPLATLRSPYVSWGECHTWEGFQKHFLRVEYGSFRLSADESDGRLLEGLRFYARDVQREAPYVWILGVAGAVHSIVKARSRRRRWFEALLLGVFIFYLIFFHSLANMELEGRPDLVEVIQRFWMMPAVIMFVYIGHGFFVCASAVKLSPMIMRVVVLAVAAAATHRSFWVMDQSSNIYSSEFGRALLAPLPHNALVLVMTDLATNSMRYVQAVDRYRADVFVLDQNLMSTDWFMPNHAKHFFGVSFPSTKYWPSDPFGYDLKEFIDSNFGRFRIFIFPHFKDNSPLEGGYSLIPFGYMEEVVRRQGDGQSTPWTFKPLEWLNGVRDHLPSVPSIYNTSVAKYPPGSWEFKPREDFVACMNKFGIAIMNLVSLHPEVAIPLAVHVYTHALSIGREEIWGGYHNMYKNLGHACLYGVLQLSGKAQNSLTAEQRGQRAKYMQCMHAGYNEWLLSVSLGQVLPAGSMLDHEVVAVQQLLQHYAVESPPLGAISHSKTEGSSKANPPKHSSKPAKQQRKSDL